ncbi:MAG: Rpn family recombination-promoting nuclease/putative transposase [Bacteroidales bacterium]|nr:Rpn family recombination-promoting nuclease/putative transposase [Bacteroidales bacterium]
MGKYITFDWFIKKLLRNKGNSVVLEGFLSVLFKRQIKIQKILESEGNQEFENQKYNRVDLLVEDSDGEKFIIEVQNDYEIDFFQRMLFGTSKVVTEYIKEGEVYGSIQKIYSVNIVYIALGQGKGYFYKGTTVFRNMRNKREVLKLSKRQKEVFKRKNVWDIFPEYYLLRVNKFDEEVKEPLQEWISFLKTGDIPKSYTAQGLAEAREVMRVSELDEEERKAYERYIDSIRISRSVAFSYDDLGYTRGIEVGRAEGRAEGAKQQAVETARKMKLRGYPADVIADMTGLTPDEISKI